MKSFLIGFVFALAWSGSLLAQEPVSPIPDAVSYATAIVNPAVAIWKAAHSSQPLCTLGQFGLSELIGNTATFGIKKVVASPRPCAGCDAHGMPSGHAMNSVIGVSSSWRFGVYFSVGTAQLRTEAHRHTPLQVVTGLAIGAGSEWAGQKLIRCRE